ncbi:uncharacterized protein SCHCODRAFT_02624349 [Schizophyllum commune H4-8]|uniref:Uncharacterized protein n=1 Tax=Schizophyllum commune (strain H4-8 / FGSC 9210) TaxID=578458 RepID=D8PLE5_SCHCM|nr:uncharacterized protein SCHCODRAFT_02624349 [Schizophyllum commune H4-8]KAI5894321.1 hypothetical protein SCHCODRAFT_02624349 [Schizophyllum commune H4-8]
MPLFGRRHHATAPSSGGGYTHHHHRRTVRHHKDPAHVTGGYKAALANPNTTSAGRRHAKHELRKRGESTHVPLMVRIKRTLGIRSTPRTYEQSTVGGYGHHTTHGGEYGHSTGGYGHGTTTHGTHHHY